MKQADQSDHRQPDQGVGVVAGKFFEQCYTQPLGFEATGAVVGLFGLQVMRNLLIG